MEQIIEILVHWDQQVMLAIHGLSNPFFDQLMAAITEKYNWIPLYLLLVYLLVRQFGWHALYSIAAVVLLVVISDQLTSSFMKPFFQRFRPCHDPEIGHMVRIITKCGGYYGFVSSHAANSFAVTTFFWCLFHRRFPWIGWIVLWPLVVGYSRIYLGVHYPLDILGGALVGIVLGYMVFGFTRLASQKVPFNFRITGN